MRKTKKINFSNFSTREIRIMSLKFFNMHLENYKGRKQLKMIKLKKKKIFEEISENWFLIVHLKKILFMFSFFSIV